MQNTAISQTQANGNPKGTNFPLDPEGRTYHLGLKRGELANRILLVGDPDRAELIAKCLDVTQPIFHRATNRGFITYTGFFKEKKVSIVSIGMGYPMMEMFVHEARNITEGMLYMTRLGSCGTPNPKVAIGAVIVAAASYFVFAKKDSYHNPNHRGSHFEISDYPIKPDPELHRRLLEKVRLHHDSVVEGIDATADTFYGSQGRTDAYFRDENETLIDEMMEKYPETGSLQMESAELFHQGSIGSEIKTAACSIVLAQRRSDDFLGNAKKHEIELKVGKASLEALTAMN